MRFLRLTACAIFFNVGPAFIAIAGEEKVERLTLAEVLALARESNLDVRLARERLLEAAGALKVSRSDLLPDLSGSVMQTRQDRATGAYGLPESAEVTAPDPINGTINYNAPDSVIRRLNLPTETTVEFPDPIDLDIAYSDTTRTYNWFNAKLRLSVPILNVRNVREYQATTSNERRIQMEVIRAEEKAMNVAATTFLRILFADASLEALRVRIGLQEQRVAYMKDQEVSGLAIDLEIMKEQQALVSLKTELKSTLNARRQSLRELADLIGWEDGDALELDGRLMFLSWTMPAREAALELAYERRADFLAQLEREKAARLQQDAARADYYPTIKAFGTYGYEGDRFDDTVDTWMIGAMMSVPIWDFYGRKGRLEQRASMLAQTANRTEAMRQSIAFEVKGTLDALELTEEALELGLGAVHLASENLRLKQDQFDAGVAGPMDVNSAEAELAKAQLKEQETLYNFNLAAVMFWSAIGRTESYLDVVFEDSTKESTTTPEPPQNESPD
ncbi:MAG TPA: TolC family protein [Kiritimatiellia bacterium]|nr:TolC family protein [Kiritimatiellia bacterium]